MPGILIYLSAVALLLAVGGLCVFYLTHTHQYLVQWYLTLGNCLYNGDVWQQQFFNGAVKSEGNKLAAAGLAITLLLLLYTLRSWRAYMHRQHNALQLPAHLPGYAAVAITAVVLATWSWAQAAPATDEVFSAVNCAALHPIQTVTYYMLPNNHLYFNLANNLLFSWVGNFVLSGRFISLLAYVATILIAFHWLKQLTGNLYVAFVAVLPVALQFTVWAMGAQARAYECQLLCGWAAFVSLIGYVRHNHRSYLRINTLCHIAGFALLQTWLHIFVFQCVVMALVMVHQRHLRKAYLLHICIAAGFTFLLYLPAFCFSGLGAFTGNNYVKPATEHWQDFLPGFFSVSRYFINYAFSIHSGEDDLVLDYVLFLLPLFLLLSRKGSDRLLALCYLLLWLVYGCITVYLRLNPFNRNMIVHYSLSMGLVMYTFYTMVGWFARLVQRPGNGLPNLAAFAVPVLLFAAMLAARNKREGSFFLYYYDVNLVRRHHTEDMRYLPKSATIGCSNEAFYMYYRCYNEGYNVNRCFTGTEQYYVRRKTEPLPPQANGYQKFADGYDDYEFYRKIK